MAGETIGFVGTGRMGGPMAGRLMDAGYSLSIYDTQDEATKSLVARGARLAKSAAEVASSADIVLISLPTPDIVKAVTSAWPLSPSRLAFGRQGLSGEADGDRARDRLRWAHTCEQQPR
jgi:prephenate dehydrogenase